RHPCRRKLGRDRWLLLRERQDPGGLELERLERLDLAVEFLIALRIVRLRQRRELRFECLDPSLEALLLDSERRGLLYLSGHACDLTGELMLRLGQFLALPIGLDQIGRLRLELLHSLAIEVAVRHHLVQLPVEQRKYFLVLRTEGA